MWCKVFISVSDEKATGNLRPGRQMCSAHCWAGVHTAEELVQADGWGRASYWMISVAPRLWWLCHLFTIPGITLQTGPVWPHHTDVFGSGWLLLLEGCPHTALPDVPETSEGSVVLEDPPKYGQENARRIEKAAKIFTFSNPSLSWCYSCTHELGNKRWKKLESGHFLSLLKESQKENG